MKQYLLAAAALATIPHAATAADLIKTPAAAARPPQRLSEAPIYQNPVYKGRVAVMDGRTLWYPQYAQRVRLVEIDACELPQWAIDPKWVDRERQKAPSPIPCGPIAKAWLKRTIGSKRSSVPSWAMAMTVSPRRAARQPAAILRSRCFVSGGRVSRRPMHTTANTWSISSTRWRPAMACGPLTSSA